MRELEQIQVTDETGSLVDAQAPIIVSASRATDIPAFYADWLMERLEKGFVKWVNPFNGVPLYVSFAKTRLFVFWSKNPKPIMKYLDAIDQRGINYYFQFTVNDYDAEHYEPGVPSLKERVDTFISLSERLGKKRVIWRCDPLLLTDEVSVDDLLAKVERLGNQLAPHTARLVFSFADIDVYGKVGRNLAKASVMAREFTTVQMEHFARGLAALNQRWGLSLATCAEKCELQLYGVEHNRCIDDRLMIDCFHKDAALMRFLGHEPDLFGEHSTRIKLKKLADKGQRVACNCVKSKDIGEYNTCPHCCIYCYANSTPQTAIANYRRHLNNPHSPSIRG